MNAGILSFVTAFSVSTLIGYFAGSFLWPRGLSRGILWAGAPVIGCGICSLIFFAFRRPMFTVEIALLIVLAAGWRRWRQPFPASSVSRHWTVPSLLLAGTLGFVISGLLVAVTHVPHGDWDAFAIWNSHARYLYRDGPAWQNHIQNTFHADYPLLVPAMNARAWRYAGHEIPETGGWIGLIFTISGIAMLIATLVELRNTRLGLTMGLVLLSTPFYLEYGVSQSADVPLSVYYLGTLALLCLYSERASEEPGLLVLAGFTAGCAGWTKNEGLIFILGVSIALLATAVARPVVALRRYAAFAAGLILPLAVTLVFKFEIASGNELWLNRHSAEIAAKLLNPDRYLTIFGSLGQIFWSFGDWAIHPVLALLIFIGLCGVNRTAISKFGWRVSAGTLLIVLAGYFAVYVVTPFELKWYIDGSASRLFLQLWPPSLLLAGLVAVQ